MLTHDRPAPPLTTQRRPHWVGTLPLFPDAASGFEWQLQENTPPPRRVVGDEPDQWILEAFARLGDVPNLRRVRDGQWRTYDDREQYRPRAGTRVQPSEIAGALRIADRALKEDRILTEIAGAHAPTLQVSVPSFLDFTGFAFTKSALALAAGPVLRGLTSEVREVIDGARNDIVLQLESPMATIGTADTPAPLQPAAAAALADVTLRQVRALPTPTGPPVVIPSDFQHRGARTAADWPSLTAPHPAPAQAAVRRSSEADPDARLGPPTSQRARCVSRAGGPPHDRRRVPAYVDLPRQPASPPAIGLDRAPGLAQRRRANDVSRPQCASVHHEDPPHSDGGMPRHAATEHERGESTPPGRR